MNPYTLVEDLKRVGFLNPLFAKSFSIDCAIKEEEYWVISIKTSLGSIYIRGTDLGYSELSLPVISIPAENLSFFNNIIVQMMSFHGDCMGNISVEQDGASYIILYHLPLVDNYDQDLLEDFTSTVSDEAAVINSYINSLDSKDGVLNLDQLKNSLEFMEEDEDEEDEDDQSDD